MLITEEIWWRVPEPPRRDPSLCGKETMERSGVWPEFEIFDTRMLGAALRLVQEGWVTGHLHFDFVMGVPGGMPAISCS